MDTCTAWFKAFWNLKDFCELQWGLEECSCHNPGRYRTSGRLP